MKPQHKRWIALFAALVGAALLLWKMSRFPADTTPQGAYMRIANSLGRDDPSGMFAYLDDDAQPAVFSIRDYAVQARGHIQRSYPKAQQTQLLPRYEQLANAGEAPQLWALLAHERGFIKRLRRDLSGVVNIEINGPRATITTARGTRYPLRKRDNGIWGLTLFTAELLAEKERLARDAESVKRAAEDYQRAASP